MVQKVSEYSARNIEILEGLDPVRRRPGMYIGSTDQRGLHQLVTEIVEAPMPPDEALVSRVLDVLGQPASPVPHPPGNGGAG